MGPSECIHGIYGFQFNVIHVYTVMNEKCASQGLTWDLTTSPQEDMCFRDVGCGGEMNTVDN
jgi:hypothetical protein